MDFRQVQNPDANITANMGILAGGFEDMTDQGCCRRLTIGPRNRHHLRTARRLKRLKRAGEDFHIADDLNAGRLSHIDRPMWLRMGERHAG